MTVANTIMSAHKGIMTFCEILTGDFDAILPSLDEGFFCEIGAGVLVACLRD